MTEEQLIANLQQLKQIKPRQEWVIFAKAQILKRDNAVTDRTRLKKRLTNIFQMAFQRRLAYALAAFLFIAVGVFSTMSYILPNNTKVKTAQQSSSNLVAENTLKHNVENFKVKSQNLAQAVKNKEQTKNISLAVKEVKDAANELTNAVKKDPQLAKTIATDVNNSKSYLDIPGDSGLKETSDDLYKTVDDSLIKDLDNTALTPNQQKALDIVKNLYTQGKFSDALQGILSLNNANDSNKNNNGSTLNK